MKNTFIILIAILITVAVNAQKQDKKNIDQEQIKSLKVSFYTEKLALTVKEAQDFWAVFNDCQDKLDKLFFEEFSISKSLKKGTVNENEILLQTDRLYEIKTERLTIEKEYYEKYKKILPPKKVSALYTVEKEFKKYLIKKVNKEKSSENQ